MRQSEGIVPRFSVSSLAFRRPSSPGSLPSVRPFEGEHPQAHPTKSMPSSTKDPLLSLLHQYASLQPLHQLELPSSLVLARSQPWIVDHVLLNPQLVRYPPDRRYRKGFLKILVARLEEGCNEAAEEEELVSRSARNVINPTSTHPTDHSALHSPPSHRRSWSPSTTLI